MNHDKSRQKRVLLLCAEGVEEMEFITIADILIRCGIRVVTAGVHSFHGVKGRQDLYLRPDYALSSVLQRHFDAVILPGGENGAKQFAESKDVGEVLKRNYSHGSLICAICAAPTALKAHKIGIGKHLTSYPSFQEDLKSCYIYEDKRVVVDGQLITSQGPGSAQHFALEIAEQLVGAQTAKEVAGGMLIS